MLAVILFAQVVAFGICLICGQFLFGETEDPRLRLGWAGCIGVASALAGILLFLGRGANPRLFRKEGLALVGVGWILASLVGALPYLWVLQDCGWGDALFESTSGITTTGASVFANLEDMPRSLLLWRAMSQWIGGLGVVVFFVAILSSLGAGAKILFFNESTTHSADVESGRLQQAVLQIMGLYLLLSAACLLVFRQLGMEWFEAFCHMFTTVSTGGFSTFSNSVAGFDSAAIEWAFMVFMFLGGICFAAQIAFLGGNWRVFAQNTEIKAFVAILLFAIASLVLMSVQAGDGGDLSTTIRACAFQVVSLATTSGFTTVDYENWLPAGQTILLVLMLIGGCSGSTSGGSKVIRIVVGAKVCLLQIELAFRSRVVRNVTINRRILSKEDQQNVLSFLLLLGMLTLLCLPLLALLERNLSFTGEFSAVISCLFNIGPGFGEVGPSQTYAGFNSGSKVVLSLLMIMGRVELLAILALFHPALWRRFS